MTISQLADQASERANKAAQPNGDGPFTTKHAMARALHERASKLHFRAKVLTENEDWRNYHETKHAEHFDKAAMYR